MATDRNDLAAAWRIPSDTGGSAIGLSAIDARDEVALSMMLAFEAQAMRESIREGLKHS